MRFFFFPVSQAIWHFAALAHCHDGSFLNRSVWEKMGAQQGWLLLSVVRNRRQNSTSEKAAHAAHRVSTIS